MILDSVLILGLVGGIVSIIVAVVQTWPNRGAGKRSDVDRAIAERDNALGRAAQSDERAERLAVELENSRRDERIAQEAMSRLRRQLLDAGIRPAE